MKKMTSVSFNIICFCTILGTVTLHALEVKFDKEHQQVKQHKAATFICSLTDSNSLAKPMTACEMIFSRINGSTRPSTELDLSAGHNSSLPPEFKFFGRGLKSGECGLTILPSLLRGLYTLTCRVIPERSRGWIYSKPALLYINNRRHLPNVMTPRDVVARSGSRINFTVVADGKPLNLCSFWLPPWHTFIDFSSQGLNYNDQSILQDYGIQYYGRGLEKGDCGISLIMRENQSGLVFSFISGIRDGYLSVGGRIASLTVANDVSEQHVSFGNINIDNRIVGGISVEISNFPYQVALLQNTETGSIFECGGNIISSQFVLTAAHCIFQNLYVRVGSSFWASGGITHQIVEDDNYPKQHPSYDPTVFDFDIGLIKVQEPFDYTSSIQPISLIQENFDVQVGMNLVVTGWGFTEANGDTPSDDLRGSMMTTIENNVCKETYSDLTNLNFCTFNQNNAGSCNGDSGGPAAYQDNENNIFLVGLTSFGTAGACGQYPSVFVNLAHPVVNSWIRNNM